MSNMLESYSLDFKGKKNGEKEYQLKFKVAKGVGVTFEQDGDINKIQLRYGTGGNDTQKNYNVKGPLNVQFFQHPQELTKSGDPGPVGPDPEITIEP
ncbi:hypothetical protein [Urechidicola vernalis]|uniref:Uncharacterized protein n=1 Tax=Urechidicola vernalis TaxID=3075600 RepID=A0ABU2Y4X4_9FLAO|nr:hypothetical protein [Urechidicola sp. P050]MDT0552840.1 hypothetical protein [Urechidicola sp. P050]